MIAGIHSEAVCIANLQKRLYSVAKAIGRGGDEGVERVAETALADELQRGTAHPIQYVDFLTIFRARDLG